MNVNLILKPKKFLEYIDNNIFRENTYAYLSPYGINLEAIKNKDGTIRFRIFIGGLVSWLGIQYPEKRTLNSFIYSDHLNSFITETLKIERLDQTLSFFLVDTINKNFTPKDAQKRFNMFLQETKKIQLAKSIHRPYFEIIKKIYLTEKSAELIKKFIFNSTYFGQTNLIALYAAVYDKLPEGIEEKTISISEIDEIIYSLNAMRSYKALSSLAKRNKHIEQKLEEMGRANNKLFTERDYEHYLREIIGGETNETKRNNNIEKTQKI